MNIEKLCIHEICPFKEQMLLQNTKDAATGSANQQSVIPTGAVTRSVTGEVEGYAFLSPLF
jgi:hypothetical protein